MGEQMPNLKKNRGIAIEGIKEDIAKGNELVVGTEMSVAWQRAKDQAVQQLLSGEHGDRVEFSGASKSFYVTREKPTNEEAIVNKIEDEENIIYIVIDDLN
jgi:hypothetical protein